MFSQKKKKKSVIFLSEKNIRYVSLVQNGLNFMIDAYDKAELKSGVIQGNELVEIEFLSKVLSKIQKDLSVNKIDLLLPHNFFIHKKISLDTPFSSEKKMKKALFKKLSNNIDNYPWVTTHSFETIFYKNDQGVDAHVQMLSQENYRAFIHAFEKAGLHINAIHSEDFAFEYIFPKEKKVAHLRVFSDFSRLSFFEKGMHRDDHLVNFSYNEIYSLLQKNHDKAESFDVLKKHGLFYDFDTSAEQSLFHMMAKTMNSLQKHLSREDIIFVSFEHEIIPGFIDILKKNFAQDIQILDPMYFPKYLPGNIHQIHKDEVHHYSSCLWYLAGNK